MGKTGLDSSILKLRSGLLIVVMLWPAQAFACNRPPDVQGTGVDELIQRTSTIALAQVYEARYTEEPYRVEYSFKVERVLKGVLGDSFELEGVPLLVQESMRTFESHTARVFWETGSGRLIHNTDCEIHPSFSVGATYLVFLDKPYHNKSFEQIIRTHGDEDTKDKWLLFVEKKTSPRE